MENQSAEYQLRDSKERTQALYEETGRSVVRLNQHFLTDDSVMDQIVELAEIEPDETVLEIGAGQGNLTSRIAARAKHVIAIEADQRLRPRLERLQEYHPNVHVLYGNALGMRLPRFDRIVSNIPFNITEPLMMKLFNERFTATVLLVGETFANNFYDNGGTRLGILTRAHFRGEYLLQVGRESFEPTPSTDATLIGLYPVKKKELEREFPLYIVRCLWNQKTRPLRDALSAALYQYISSRGGGGTDLSKTMGKFEEENPYIMGSRVDTLTNEQFSDIYHRVSGIRLKRLFGGHKPRGGAKNWRQTYEMYLQ